jgi:hypothetical protein
MKIAERALLIGFIVETPEDENEELLLPAFQVGTSIAV